MSKYIRKVIVTNLPAFYKINLYNRINSYCKLLVIYTGTGGSDRNRDFFYGQMEFEHICLEGNILKKSLVLLKILYRSIYAELIIGGWDSLYMWLATISSLKIKNALVVESSDKESTTTGMRGFMKRIFLKRISKAYVSGKAHVQLMCDLNFKGTIQITHGVGLFNIIPQPTYKSRREVRTFLYVGRLAAVKNLEWLIRRFNEHDELILNIVGFGELEEFLQSIAKPNVHFYGAINNSELSEYYQAADVFILPSLSEPWGLVVEEALNNGTPVMLSDRVGCIDDINERMRIVFALTKEDFEEKLAEITDIERYNDMREAISHLDYYAIEEQQVRCYI